MKKQLKRQDWIIYTNLIKEAHMESINMFSILRKTFPKHMLNSSVDKINAGFLRLKAEMDDELAMQIPPEDFFGLAYGDINNEDGE